MRKFASGLLPVLIMPVLFLSQSGVVAQNGMHMMHGNAGAIAQTMPADDAVLETAPAELMLTFQKDVRLVKLTLHRPDRSWVDIGFRYDPSADTSFSWSLPALAQEDYYTADWAIIDVDDTVTRGRFRFAFGPNARPPSASLPDQMEMEHTMVPDYRTLFQDRE